MDQYSFVVRGRLSDDDKARRMGELLVDLARTNGLDVEVCAVMKNGEILTGTLSPPSPDRIRVA